MKKPIRFRPCSASRRDFLRGVGLAGTTLAVTPWLAACSDDDAVSLGGRGMDAAGSNDGVSGDDSNDGPPDRDVAIWFEHGVASGDPLPEAVILWTRLSPEAASERSITGRYDVARDEAMRDLVATGTFTTGAERDYTVKIDCSGLSPDTGYYYRFEANGSTSPVGRTRTAPVGNVSHLRLAFTSCSQYRDGYFNVYGALARRDDIDVVLHLGDYIYETGTPGDLGEVHAPEPPREIVTLDDYRIRYAQYRRDGDLQALHARHPMIVVWDDHESTNDSWKDGAENHQPDTEGDWQARKAASIRAYYEWLPIREVEPGRPERIYRRLGYGDLVDLVMLDTRLIGRDRQADSPASADTLGDEKRTMLGFEQEAWLASELSRSVAQWKLLGQQVMFMPLRIGLPRLLELDLLPALDQKLSLLTDGGVVLNVDQWDGYPAARDRLIDQIRIQGLDDVVVLSGDIHTSWAQDVTEDPNNPLIYDPIAGHGSRAVEFVCPSVTSSGLPELQPLRDSLRLFNPHMKYIDLESHGYVLLDITPERLQGQFWYVDTITQPSTAERLAAAFETRAGHNRLQAVDIDNIVAPAA